MDENEAVEIPAEFVTVINNYAKMIDDKKPKVEIDNELCRLKEKYGLGTRLNRRGYKKLKRILDKYWSGKRLDNQELTVAYAMCPKIILYEKITFRMFDMIHELEEECIQRWGDISPPLKPNTELIQMTEPNPDYLEFAIPALDSITTNVPFEESWENYRLLMAYIKTKHVPS